jgi:hypothetical protein
MISWYQSYDLQRAGVQVASAGVGYSVGRHLRDLPRHVKHWPAGDTLEIAQDILIAPTT